jgi:hypothetical protein
MESIASDRAARPGTSCEVCGLPARRRVPVQKPGWRVPEFRDLCLECAHEVAALVLPSMTVARVPAEPTRSTLAEELMSEPIADASKSCKEHGCTKTDLVARGYCAAHYSQHKRNGDFDNNPLRPGLPRRPATTATVKAAPTPPRPRTTPAPAPSSSAPRFTVRLGELVVECRELDDVVALHRALGT